MLNHKIEIYVDQTKQQVTSTVRPICPEHPQDQLAFSPEEAKTLHGISVAAVKTALDLEKSLFPHSRHSRTGEAPATQEAMVRTHETEPNLRTEGGILFHSMDAAPPAHSLNDVIIVPYTKPVTNTHNINTTPPTDINEWMKRMEEDAIASSPGPGLVTPPKYPAFDGTYPRPEGEQERTAGGSGREQIPNKSDGNG